jgi:hypothetical protein
VTSKPASPSPPLGQDLEERHVDMVVGPPHPLLLQDPAFHQLVQVSGGGLARHAQVFWMSEIFA